MYVSTVVAAHWMSPDAIARWRSFCGIFLMVTSTPFFLKIPASLASVSGANPVQPEMPRATWCPAPLRPPNTRGDGDGDDGEVRFHALLLNGKGIAPL